MFIEQLEDGVDLKKYGLFTLCIQHKCAKNFSSYKCILFMIHTPIEPNNLQLFSVFINSFYNAEVFHIKEILSSYFISAEIFVNL